MQIRELYDTPDKVAVDYISGMTDKFAIDLYNKIK
jgi:dGTP triphosphohydrolase